jgi:hypothetical protein
MKQLFRQWPEFFSHCSVQENLAYVWIQYRGLDIYCFCNGCDIHLRRYQRHEQEKELKSIGKMKGYSPGLFACRHAAS